MCANYSSLRRTKITPMVVIFRVVNISAGINSYVLYQAFNSTPNITRLYLMKGLASSLVIPLMQRRLASTIPRELSLTIRRILDLPEEPPHHNKNTF